MISAQCANKIFGLVGITALLLGASIPAAHAQADVTKCDAALRSDTYERHQDDYWSVYAASLLTKSEWEKLKQQFSGKMVIYGIPMSGDFESYHDQSQSALSKYSYTGNFSKRDDVLRSELSPYSAAAYSNCLASQLHGMAAWVSDVHPATVTIKLNFETASDDKRNEHFSSMQPVEKSAR